MLAQFYPPIIGGEELHVRNLSIELAARGHDVVVATLGRKEFPRFEIDRGVHIHRIGGTMQRMSVLFSENERQYAPPFPDPEVLWALRRIILQERPDIIHAHNWMVHSFIPLKAWSKAKLVVTLHSYNLVCATERLMYRGAVCSGPTLFKCLRCASEHFGVTKGLPTTVANLLSGMVERGVVDMFLPISQAVAEGTQLAKYGVPYRVVPNFVANNVDELCDNAHPLLSQLPQEDFLLFVGDVVRDKGVEVLFQAYAEMEQHLPLVLIGRAATDLSTSYPWNTRVLQSWPHEAVMSAWSRCSIALVPSIWPDPCPTVAIEAMTMGKPVIASCTGGLSDIVIDGETGFLVPPGDPRALREAIQLLLENPERRKHMGNMAMQRAIEFQARTLVPCIEQIYRETVQS